MFILAGGYATEACLEVSYPSEEDVGKNPDGCRAEGSSDSDVSNHVMRSLMVGISLPSRIVTISWQMYNGN